MYQIFNLTNFFLKNIGRPPSPCDIAHCKGNFLYFFNCSDRKIFMNVLIVFAHHEPHSFNAAMKNLAVDVMRSEGHEVVVSDLYAMNFNPVASASDFCQRTKPEYLISALEQRNAYANQSFSAEIAEEIKN